MNDSLIKLARSNPLDKRTVQLLFDDYEAAKEHDPNYELTYLQLKWFYSNKKWRYLNKIAKYYLNYSKINNAFFCFIASLCENYAQPEIIAAAESLREISMPIIPEKLRDNRFAVSVIMPTYNRTTEIKNSIKSVLRQSFKDFELVIINDGGRDAVKEVVDSFISEKIKYYKLQQNKGLAGALNEGILRAEGKYIAYLDDDDIYYENHLGNLIETIEKRPKCDLIYSNAWWCFGEVKGDVFLENSRKLLGRRPNKFDRELLFRNNYISTLNILHRKDCFKKCGLFNEELVMCMDWELWLRFSLECNIYQLNVISGEYRFKGNNMSTVDELSMAFFPSVIRKCCETNYGKVIFLKQYLKTNQLEMAKRIYGDLVSNYDRCTLRTKKELIYASKKFDYGNRGKLVVDFATDFINSKFWNQIRIIMKRFRDKKRYC
jgi:glycosyltransferase involved in cell wall biosynthesis